MAPSSAFSDRRPLLRRPKICKPPPPPPPPPPPSWPPASFYLHFQYWWWMMGMPHTRSWDCTLVQNPGLPWFWDVAGVPPENAYVSWSQNGLPNFQLLIQSYLGPMGPYTVTKYFQPVTMGTPTAYVINTWDVKPAWMTAAVAQFTF